MSRVLACKALEYFTKKVEINVIYFCVGTNKYKTSEWNIIRWTEQFCDSSNKCEVTTELTWRIQSMYVTYLINKNNIL